MKKFHHYPEFRIEKDGLIQLATDPYTALKKAGIPATGEELVEISLTTNKPSSSFVVGVTRYVINSDGKEIKPAKTKPKPDKPIIIVMK